MKTAGRRVCALMSGGLDSAVLVSHFLEKGLEVWPAYVASAFRWERAELHWARRYLKAVACPRLKPLSILRLDQRDVYPSGHWALKGRVPAWSAPDKSVYMEGRNFLLLSKAGAFCARKGIGRIALAILKANPFPDARPEFFRSMAKAIRTGLDWPIRIEAPFARIKKEALIERASHLPLELTFSCMNPRGLDPCGRCAKCRERILALRRALRNKPSRKGRA